MERKKRGKEKKRVEKKETHIKDRITMNNKDNK